MDKIARVRQEIERRMKIYKESNYGISLRYQELEELLSFLDTLSEESDKSLEEAAETHVKNKYCLTKLLGAEIREAVNDFIAGAEWQARQLLQGSPMPEDTVLFQKGVAEGRRLEREDILKDAIPFYEILKAVPSLERENTRIIVVKDESK